MWVSQQDGLCPNSKVTARSSCTKCKREYGLFGVLLGEQRRRTGMSPVERKIQSKRRRQEGPADDLCSPALVQMHGTTDQRRETLTDTESMFATSHDAATHFNDGSCGTCGDASDDASRGASNIEPGDYESVVPMDAPCYANDSSGPVQEAFSDTDVIDAEDYGDW